VALGDTLSEEMEVDMAGELVRQKMAHAFGVLDTDSSGSLEVGDFERVVANFARETGLAPDSESLAGFGNFLMSWWKALSAGADTNADGIVTLEEFTSLFIEWPTEPIG
jgi:Ca2+-binding EF-hand superfamily protein